MDGMSTLDVARITGTSLATIEKHYGHLVMRAARSGSPRELPEFKRDFIADIEADIKAAPARVFTETGLVHFRKRGYWPLDKGIPIE
jgi:hypothetical protein